MAALYQGLGHDVTVVALLSQPGRLAKLKKSLWCAVRLQRWTASYRVRRVLDVEDELASMRASGAIDALVVNFDQVERYATAGLGLSMDNQALYLRDLESVSQASASTFPQRTILVANSGYTGGRYASATGREVLVVPPQISPERYATTSSRQFVSFVNPVRQKGVDLALQVAAALPDIPFLFIEGWPLSKSGKAALQERIGSLHNVRLLDSFLDMRRVYARTRMMLVPSQWDEAFCRVVVEAQASGIPAVASKRGGLPDTVGDAGLVLGAEEPADVWASAVREVWSDPLLYARLSENALVSCGRHYDAARSAAQQLLALLESRAQAARGSNAESIGNIP